ncbi:hypothetical protein ZWY2020_039292 [Hordeum vulgare]|nr:hypothetical protein ZWY2020_039292 [Hordeum vulgare]
MTKGQTNKMEARKKKTKAAAAQRRQRPLPAGWIQGDFLPSTVTEGDLLELVEHGQLVHKSWRLPADDEVEPAPREGERVLLLSHVHRDRPAPPKQLALSKAEKNDIQPLVEALVDVVRRGVTGIDLLEVFIGRRIQPLQARHHAMWHYTGPEDSTRTNVEGILEEKVTSWVLQITGPCENPKGARRVTPYSADNPPSNQEWTNWSSPVSNGNPEEEEEEGSQEGSVESAEYVSDSGESEEEDSEEEEEDEEPDSPPPRPEHRSKRRHEPAVPSALLYAECSFAAPAVPSVRGTKRARDAAAELAGQSSRAPKPSGPKLRKALPRMRMAIPVTSTVATSATSPARQGDDPMDTDDVVSSQPGAICLDEGDQGRADPVVEPVLEPVLELSLRPLFLVPPLPPTLPRPKCLHRLKCLHRVNRIRCVPEEQVGAAKGAMIQAELMAGEAKRAYDSVAALYRRSLELRDDIRKTCEMGTAYEALRAERNQYAGELEAAMLAMAGMKDALEVREKSLEEALEANRVLVAEVERLKKQRTELHNQMAVRNKRWTAQEKYVNDWAVQMMTRLAAAAVERSMKGNVPLGEDANRDLLRAHIRVGKVGPFFSRLREVIGLIEKELWPEDESRQEMETLLGRLEEIPDRVQAWKKSAVRCGADVALSLVRVHCKEVREDKLKALKVANTKKLQFEDFMETFLETATRIADGIDLDTFVEPSSPDADPANA